MTGKAIPIDRVGKFHLELPAVLFSGGLAVCYSVPYGTETRQTAALIGNHIYTETVMSNITITIADFTISNKELLNLLTTGTQEGVNLSFNVEVIEPALRNQMLAHNANDVERFIALIYRLVGIAERSFLRLTVEFDRDWAIIILQDEFISLEGELVELINEFQNAILFSTSDHLANVAIQWNYK